MYEQNMLTRWQVFDSLNGQVCILKKFGKKNVDIFSEKAAKLLTNTLVLQVQVKREKNEGRALT